jgi:hypothetical protein
VLPGKAMWMPQALRLYLKSKTPAVVTLAAPYDSKARLLLDRGAKPNVRATIWKQLRGMGDAEKEIMREFHNVTPIGYARQFQEPNWVNGPAITAIVERGGSE